MNLKFLLFLTLAIFGGCSGNNKNRAVGTGNPRSETVSVVANTKATSSSTEQSDSNIGDWPPSPALITADLTGHSLSEGVENGYHRPDWTFDIEYGDVSDLRIIQELTRTASKYLVIAEMKLSKGGNFYYLTKARINYVKSPADGSPVIDYVTSLGMRIVSDGEYDKDIAAFCADDGWGGVNCLKIRNKSEITLVVGGKVYANNRWFKFSKVVEPHGNASVGGTFGGGNVTNYRIDFVIREV